MARTKSRSEYTATQGSVYLITSDGRTLELPIPSRSPSDPLNWSWFKKSLSILAVFLFSVIGLVQVQGTALVLGMLENEYTPESMRPLHLEILAFIPCIAWGVGALIWVPLSTVLGRRPVFLFCTILLTFATILAAISQSFYTHLLARCLQGIAGSISPSIALLMIIDVLYIHQRPMYIALFWCLSTSLSNVGLAATPSIVEYGGSWRSFYWIWSGPSALTIFLALFWAPESYFSRPPMAFDGRILSQAENGKVTVYSKWEEVPGGKPMLEDPPIWKATSFIKNIIFWNRTKTGGWKDAKASFRQILICALNPLIIWVWILNALVFGGMVVTCQTYVNLLMAPPYNFTFKETGLAKLSPAIGALLAFPASGILTTQVIRFLATRNRGVREPEHYLPSFILPVVTATVSLALYGVAAEGHWNWRWITLFVGVDYFSAMSLFVSNVLWVTEAFPRWAGPALVIVGANGYALSFTFSSGIVPWIRAQGFGKTYIELAAMTFAIGLIGFPVNYWGKRFREYIYARWSDDSEE
ncbi:MFS transporter-14 [Coleophoma crateriformis]|uniref:MFS transporter-14 n=1 Tax=Coleophoma crateriformis TaxID=565419 RepID=A0A3D8QYV0_9HELO|nr:MFS transporter-14 [Coleophoma crateriformis]